MIDDALYDAFGQRQISTMFTQLNQYRRRPRGASRVQERAARPGEDLPALVAGGQVPLTAITRIEESAVPLAVNHQGQFPVVTVSFNLAPGASLGDAVKAIERPGGDRSPNRHSGRLRGNGRRLPGLAAGRMAAHPGRLVTVYIVLGVLYESYIHPITILSTLPRRASGPSSP